MKYSGIDLHSNNCLVTVTDGQEQVVVEKRVANELQGILRLLQPWREELAGVVAESTCNWHWLVDGLQAAGFSVRLANAVAIRKYDGLQTVAARPARVISPTCCARASCPRAAILPPEQRALAEKRMQWAQERARNIPAAEERRRQCQE